MDSVRKWKAVYRLLDQVNTEVFDCGTLCGSACCVCRTRTRRKTGLLDVQKDSGPSREPELGIYLFPGEHLLLQEFCGIHPGGEETTEPSGGVPAKGTAPDGGNAASTWLEWETQDSADLGLPESWTEPVYFVKCKTPPVCPRKWRPLQCRTFPLKPVFGENGVLELIWNDDDLPYVCPIIENNMPIHDDFYKATYTVWTHLLRDPRIFDLVLSWS